jgi:HrpA-like RNA helicase
MTKAIAKALVPEALADKPVAQHVTEFDFRQRNLIFVAETGAAKTTVLPAFEASLGLRQGPVLVRQPAKVVATGAWRSIQKFWPDLKVGISTSDRKENLDGADVIVFSDGSLRGLMARETPAAVYFDEAHVMTVACELDLAYARHHGQFIRCMSGTVDPVRLASYLNEAETYQIRGRTFPVARDTILAPDTIFKRNDTYDLEGRIHDFCQMLVEECCAGMVFLPTRALVEKMAESVSDVLDAAPLHGGVDPLAMLEWAEARAGKPWCVFSTTAGATGITLDITHTLICDEEISSTMERGIETMHAGPLSDGALLQMAGRVGRLRPGTATLLTPHRWRTPVTRDRTIWCDAQGGHVRPRPIDTPCARITPYDVKVQMAAAGIPWSDEGTLLSRIDPKELEHATSWLRANGILLPDGTLSPLGQRIARFPLAAQYAHLVLSAPKELQTPLLATLSLGLGGTYRLVRVEPKQLVAARASNPTFSVWPRDCIVWGSIPLTLAATLRRFTMENDGGQWCSQNNLKHWEMSQALDVFRKAARHLGGDSMPLDLGTLRKPLWDHLSRHPLFYPKTIRQGVAYPRQPFSPYDEVFREAFGLDHRDLPLKTVAIMRRQKTKAGGFFFPLDLCHAHPEERP